MPAKTWFITGTSRGLGREWAIAALDRGDQVAATARDTATLRDLADHCGDAILPLRLDVTDRERASPRSAILQVFDASNLPLRMFLGRVPLGIATSDCDSRFATWREWQPASGQAQGGAPARLTRGTLGATS